MRGKTLWFLPSFESFCCQLSLTVCKTFPRVFLPQQRGIWIGWGFSHYNHSRGQLKGDDSIGYFSSISMSLSDFWRLIDQFGCGQSENEPDCTGLCLLLTFLVITVFVIIVIVILMFFFFLFLPVITQLICLSIKRWNLKFQEKCLQKTLWKRVEGT